MTKFDYPPPPNTPAKQIQHRDRILMMLRERGLEPTRIEDIPDDDAKTWELIHAGDTEGIFGLEPEIFSKVQARMKPENLHDLAAMITLNRRSTREILDEYIARKNGKPWSRTGSAGLDATLGVVVYREQAEQMAYPEADRKLCFPRAAALGWARFAWTMAYFKSNLREEFEYARGDRLDVLRKLVTEAQNLDMGY